MVIKMKKDKTSNVLAVIIFAVIFLFLIIQAAGCIMLAITESWVFWIFALVPILIIYLLIKIINERMKEREEEKDEINKY